MNRRALGACGLVAALALAAADQTRAQSATEVAVEAAKTYAGTKIAVLWEMGLPALELLRFSAPRWQELTGIEVEVVELPVAAMPGAILDAHRTGSGAYDVLSLRPAWMRDLVEAGALEVPDPYVDRYGYRAELEEIAPAYRDNQMTVDGRIYGFPDDGDVLVMYYPDVFQADGLELPRTWTEFARIARKLTIQYGPVATAVGGVRRLYGAALNRDPDFAQRMFQERFRVEGGRFFDAATMQATVNGAAGVKVFTEMRAENRFMPPGVESWGFAWNLAAFLAGKTAMTVSGRRSGAGPRATAPTPKRSPGCRSRRSPARSATPCRRAGMRSPPADRRSPSPRRAGTRSRRIFSSSG